MKKLIFQTERTILTPFKKDELKLFHALNTNSFIRRFLWDNEIIAEDVSRDILRQNEEQFFEYHHGLWKINLKSSGVAIGYTGLWYFFEESQPQLIYAILSPYTGKGLATECAKKVIDYAFDDLGFDYLIAATDEPHLPSQQVARRLGMVFMEKRQEKGKPTLFFKIEKEKNLQG